MSVQRFFQHRRHSRNSPGIHFLYSFTSTDSHIKPSNPSDHYSRHNYGHSPYVHFMNSLLPSKPQFVIPHSVAFCRSFSTRDSRIGDSSDSVVTQYENTELLISENISASVEESILPVRALISLLDGYHDLSGFPGCLAFFFGLRPFEECQCIIMKALIVGGVLWFQNLTELPSGVLGPVFPLLIAGLHYINVQVSFQKSSVRKMSGFVGLTAKYYKKYVEVLTLPILFFTFILPQGSLVYWLTNSSITVVQQLSLNHPDVRKKLGLPQKDPQLEAAHQKELGNSGEIKLDPSKSQSKISVQNLSPNELVNLSIKLLAGGRKDEAMSFLRLAIAKDPENVRALLVIGQTLLQDGSLPEATEYLELTIAKLLLKENQMGIEDVDLQILSSQWAGVACIRQGKMGVGLAHLERIATLKEPDDPKSKAHYYEGLVLLSSALINVGRKNDAINYLQMATAYDESYRISATM